MRPLGSIDVLLGSQVRPCFPARQAAVPLRSVIGARVKLRLSSRSPQAYRAGSDEGAAVVTMNRIDDHGSAYARQNDS